MANDRPEKLDITPLIGKAKIKPDRPKLRFSRIGEVLARPPKPTYFEGLFGPGDLVMLFAPPGAGKTFVALELLAAAASGRPFAGFAFTGEGDGLNVVYATGEGRAGLGGRFRALMDAGRLDSQAQDQFWVWDSDPIRLIDMGPDMPANLIAELEAAEDCDILPGILVVDTWANATAGADENDNARMGAVLRGLQAAMERWPELAIVIVHHSRKGAAEVYRGATAVEGACDLIARIEKGAGSCVLRCVKAKDFPEFADQHFTLEAEDGGSPVVRWIDQPQRPPMQKANAENVLAVLKAEWGANRAPIQAEIKTALEERGIQAAKNAIPPILADLVRSGLAIEGERPRAGNGRPPKTWEPPEGWTGDPGEDSE